MKVKAYCKNETIIVYYVIKLYEIVFVMELITA